MELKSTANVNKQWKRKSNSYHYSNKSKGRANKLENINAKCSANINTTTSKRSKIQNHVKHTLLCHNVLGCKAVGRRREWFLILVIDHCEQTNCHLVLSVDVTTKKKVVTL